MYSADSDAGNGQGAFLWAGRSSNGAFKRSALAFNLATIPPGSTITGVDLRMQVDRMPTGQPSPVPVDLHRLQQDWAEGILMVRTIRDVPRPVTRVDDRLRRRPTI